MAEMEIDSGDKSDSAPTPSNALPIPPPCVTPFNELQAILISQMQLQTHHIGKRTVLRVVPPTIRHSEGVIGGGKDQEGKVAVVQLQATCQPFEGVVPAQRILQGDRWYLIKEPLALRGAQGETILVVEHPGDMVLLPHYHEFIPVEWRRKNDVFIGMSGDVRLKGNDAVSRKNWAEAEDLQVLEIYCPYSLAVQTAGTTEEANLAYLNRSLVNLRLGRPATALADVTKSNGTGTDAPAEKGLFREANALYELAKYDRCLDRLQALKTAFPHNTSSIPMISHVQARLNEQQTGQYDFSRMYNQAKATPPLIDCATYTMPVEIGESPGKGRGDRGVFTKRKILVGELLICEKAFGYVYSGKDRPGRGNMTVIDDQKELRTLIVQKLFHNIEDAQMFAELYNGNHNVVPVDEVDGKPVIDSIHVQKVICMTNHRSPRTNLSLLRELNSGDGTGVESIPDFSSAIGVWSFISHINHSCISNISLSFIGDMAIVRATRDLEAGAELLISCGGPLPFESYDETQERLSHWGFACDCALCTERKATPNEMILKRKSLEIPILECSQITSKDLPDVRRVLEQLEQTYSDGAAKEPGAVRLEVSFFCRVLGMALTTIGGNHTQSIVEVALKELEALGFVISVNPRLCVIQWGVTERDPIDAFRALYLAYKTTDPQNAQAAKGYMETAYSLFVGEKETFLETYPELA